jgi:two-component system, cell cycle sensor histidine kinase PleC
MLDASPSASVVIVGGDPAHYPSAAAFGALVPSATLGFLPHAAGLLAYCRRHAPLLVVLDLAGIPAPLGLMADLQAACLMPAPAVLVIGDAPGADFSAQAYAMDAIEVIDRAQARGDLAHRLSAHWRARCQLVNAHRRLDAAMELLRAAERRLVEQAGEARRDSACHTESILSIAHELRNPLNTLLGFSDLMVEEAFGPLGDPRYGEFALDMRQAAQQLLRLVEGTLDLARIDGGQVKLDLREIDIGQAVQDGARALMQMAQECGVRFEIKTPKQPLRLRTDPEKVRQIISNLASNAIKFTPKGGRVTVEARASDEGGAVILVVRDTGLGIPASDVAALKPHAARRNPDAAQAKGVGFGLPLTRRFVEMLGGTLDVATAPGQGTVVTVRLPAIPATTDVATDNVSAAAPMPLPVRQRRPAVL